MSMSSPSRPMNPLFLIAAFIGRRSQGLDGDRETEVDEADLDPAVDEYAGIDDYEEYEDEDDYNYYSHPPKHPHKWTGFSKLGCALTSLVILPVIIGLSTFAYVQWSHAQTQNYLEIAGVVQVAQVTVDPTPRYPHHMNVNLLLEDNNGHEYFDPHCSTSCILPGDSLLLQGDMITYPTWQGVLGLHTKFKLTSIKGMYANHAIARTNTLAATPINDGND